MSFKCGLLVFRFVFTVLAVKLGAHTVLSLNWQVDSAGLQTSPVRPFARNRGRCVGVIPRDFRFFHQTSHQGIDNIWEDSPVQIHEDIVQSDEEIEEAGR